MYAIPDSKVLRCARDLLLDRSMISRSAAQTLFLGDRCYQIASDASTRRFWRLGKKDESICIIVAPATASENDLAESRSVWKIGKHLRQKGVPVPQLYAWDSDTGVLLLEDLGEVRLHDVVGGQSRSMPVAQEVVDYYRETLEQLAAMQCRGMEGFQANWCWDSCRYDRKLMLARESRYFLWAFWQGLLRQEAHAGIDAEFQDIARLAGEAPADFFLHRDFQSRNIMIKDGAVRFIDFQGGRFGPLAYDLASLLIDPYSGLSHQFQNELQEMYLKFVCRHYPVEENAFNRHFNFLALQRNMQIIGAFSFLYRVRKKRFFLAFIRPALKSLGKRMQDPLYDSYPLIRTMVARGLKELPLA